MLFVVTKATLSLFALTSLQLVDDGHLLVAATQMATTLQIRSGAIDQQMPKSLSGGNQQKVVIGKWLMSNPSTFQFDELTLGVDVSAKYEIYTSINDLATQVSGILFISSELQELIGMCDRILVTNQGEIVGDFARSNFDEEQILRSAFREESRIP